MRTEDLAACSSYRRKSRWLQNLIRKSRADKRYRPPSPVRPAFRAAAHLFLVASAIFLRAAALIRRRFLAARFGATTVLAVTEFFGGRPLFLGAIPSTARTWAICSVTLFRCCSRPARAALSISFEIPWDVGILKTIVQESGSVFRKPV
jgi:hypothetical protein